MDRSPFYVNASRVLIIFSKCSSLIKRDKTSVWQEASLRLAQVCTDE